MRPRISIREYVRQLVRYIDVIFFTAASACFFFFHMTRSGFNLVLLMVYRLSLALMKFFVCLSLIIFSVAFGLFFLPAMLGIMENDADDDNNDDDPFGHLNEQSLDIHSELLDDLFTGTILVFLL